MKDGPWTHRIFNNADQDNVEADRLLNSIGDLFQGVFEWHVGTQLLADGQQGIQLLCTLAKYAVDPDLILVAHRIANGDGCLLSEGLNKGQLVLSKSTDPGVL